MIDKVYFSRLLRMILLALLLGALAACGGRDEIKRNTSAAGQAPPEYDLVLHAGKDGTFDLEGATLTVEDLRSHIRYRNEPDHQPVHTILLRPGEKEKIKNTHVLALAGIARDMKIAAYVEDNDGQLKVIQIAE
jgi:hypothetical protein